MYINIPMFILDNYVKRLIMLLFSNENYLITYNIGFVVLTFPSQKYKTTKFII